MGVSLSANKKPMCNGKQCDCITTTKEEYLKSEIRRNLRKAIDQTPVNSMKYVNIPVYLGFTPVIEAENISFPRKWMRRLSTIPAKVNSTNAINICPMTFSRMNCVEMLIYGTRKRGVTREEFIPEVIYNCNDNNVPAITCNGKFLEYTSDYIYVTDGCICDTYNLIYSESKTSIPLKFDHNEEGTGELVGCSGRMYVLVRKSIDRKRMNYKPLNYFRIFHNRIAFPIYSFYTHLYIPGIEPCKGEYLVDIHEDHLANHQWGNDTTNTGYIFENNIVSKGQQYIASELKVSRNSVSAFELHTPTSSGENIKLWYIVNSFETDYEHTIKWCEKNGCDVVEAAGLYKCGELFKTNRRIMVIMTESLSYL